MILTVWKGVKAPKPHSGEVPVASCVAFRAVQLTLEKEDGPATRWYCTSESIAWVARLESMITLLDVEKCSLDSFIILYFDLF